MSITGNRLRGIIST